MANVIKKGVIKPREVSKAFKFENIGCEFIGKLVGIRETSSVYGETEVLDFVDLEGENWIVFITSNLKGYDWVEMVGKYISLEYKEDKRNEKTKRTYKSFEVQEVEVTE
jgi:hypothetical protein